VGVGRKEKWLGKKVTGLDLEGKEMDVRIQKNENTPLKQSPFVLVLGTSPAPTPPNT